LVWSQGAQGGKTVKHIHPTEQQLLTAADEEKKHVAAQPDLLDHGREPLPELFLVVF